MMKCYPVDLAVRLEKFLALASQDSFYKNEKDVKTLVEEASQLKRIVEGKSE